MTRRFVQSLFLSASLLVPVLVAAVETIQISVDGQSVALSDVPADAWYATYVRDAAQSGIVSGYRDQQGNPIGRFGPSDPVTVAQALKIAVEGAGYDSSLYADVPVTVGDHWAGKYLLVAGGEGFSLFFGRVNVDRPADRAEVASLFADAFKLNTTLPVSARYSDVTLNTKFAGAIEALSTGGVLSGDTDSAGRPIGRFRPFDTINRAEVTKMVMVARAQFGTPGEGRSYSTSSSSSSVSSPSSSSSSSTGSVLGTIILNDDGFSPDLLMIESGSTVRFSNESAGDMWIEATDGYPGLDSLSAYHSGQSFYFTFIESGIWGFRNKLKPSQSGTLIVE